MRDTQCSTGTCPEYCFRFANTFINTVCTRSSSLARRGKYARTNFNTNGYSRSINSRAASSFPWPILRTQDATSATRSPGVLAHAFEDTCAAPRLRAAGRDLAFGPSNTNAEIRAPFAMLCRIMRDSHRTVQLHRYAASNLRAASSLLLLISLRFDYRYGTIAKDHP